MKPQEKNNRHEKVLRPQDAKVLLFDFGGVLVDLDKARCIKAFDAVGADVRPYLDQFKQSGIFSDFENGRVTCEEVARTLGLDKDTFTQAWEAFLLDVPQARLRLLLRLKERFRVALLSNTNEVHWRMAEKRYFRFEGRSIGDFFEQTFLSFRLHLQKPEPEIFHRVAADLGVRPEEILFFDDSAENCQAARQCGLQAYEAPTDGGWMEFAENLLQQKTADFPKTKEEQNTPNTQITQITPKKPKAQAKTIVATVGFFDGVHAGHQYLLHQVCDEARRQGGISLAITFRRHPRETLQSGWQAHLLSTPEEKRRALLSVGIDDCKIIDFTEEMARMTAKKFMTQYLCEKWNVCELIIGYDHRFGSDQVKSLSDFRRIGMEVGITVEQAHEFPGFEMADKSVERVSSSVIRRLLAEGDVTTAHRLLTRPYTLTGKVGHGRNNGEKMGFPTANLVPDCAQKIIPKRGVYAVEAEVNGKILYGLTNIGLRPTFHNGNDLSIETHLLDFKENIYGSALTLHFLKHLREEVPFESPDMLCRQIEKDIEDARKYFSCAH